jgi:hypothetical protein
MCRPTQQKQPLPLQVVIIQTPDLRSKEKVVTAPSFEDQVVASNESSALDEATKRDVSFQQSVGDSIGSMDGENQSTAYVESSEVDVQPALLVDVPESLANEIPLNISTVTLRLLVNESGKVDQVMIEDQSMPESAQRALIDGFSKVIFQPALMREQPVKVQLRIQLSVHSSGIGP